MTSLLAKLNLQFNAENVISARVKNI